MRDNKLKKWDECYQAANISTATAATILQHNTHLLPPAGQALDLACGRAGNAQLLSQYGFKVDAFDFSPNVINALKQQANHNISPKVWNSETDALPKDRYDVIVVSYFLQRDLFPSIINALKTGGLLFYQTWSQQINSTGPKNPNFRLQQGELLSLCAGLRIVLYREEGKLGQLEQGHRNEAWLIAEK